MRQWVYKPAYAVYRTHGANPVGRILGRHPMLFASGDDKGQVYIWWSVVAHRSVKVPGMHGLAISLALILPYAHRRIGPYPWGVLNRLPASSGTAIWKSL